MNVPNLAFSSLDSSRFGLRVFRGRIENVQMKDLAAEIISENCDVAIVRVPSGSSSNISLLSRWALPAQHTDTLVYYKCDLERYEPRPLRNLDVIFEKARQSDLPELREMIAGTFSGYTSHYHANPLFSSEKVLIGYQEWAESYFDGVDRTLWTARRENRLVAFAACQEKEGTEEAEGILYGVNPQDAGGGLYSDLIRHTQADAKESGKKIMTVSTQVNNFAVQKVWSREGFHLFEALDTFHVNALLSAGETVIDRMIIFSAEAIDRFASASGDANPIHMDDAAAQAAGFPSRIAHGVMAASEFSRILGTEVPGPGTVFGNLDLAFLRPLVVNERYRLQMRVPGGVKSSGPMHVVMIVRDGAGHPCVIGRSDILLRR